MNIAVFAGTFDPFTMGHLDIARRASRNFDKLYIAICRNPGKGGTRFTLDERLELIRDAVGDMDNVIVAQFEGILIDFCHSVGANCLIRSLRSGADIDYERQLESVNSLLDERVDTFYLTAKPELAFISSTLVRQLMDINISIDGLVPNAKHEIIVNKLNGGEK